MRPGLAIARSADSQNFGRVVLALGTLRASRPTSRTEPGVRPRPTIIDQDT